MDIKILWIPINNTFLCNNTSFMSQILTATSEWREICIIINHIKKSCAGQYFFLGTYK